METGTRRMGGVRDRGFKRCWILVFGWEGGGGWRILSRVERRHEMRHDGDGNEENGGVGDRGLGGIGFWVLGGWKGEDGRYCHVSRGDMR